MLASSQAHSQLSTSNILTSKSQKGQGTRLYLHDMHDHAPTLISQIFAGLSALCGIIAISKVQFGSIQYEAESLQKFGWKSAINFNVLICCVLLLLASGITLILEIVMLVVSLVKKTSKVFVIVVSYHNN